MFPHHLSASNVGGQHDNVSDKYIHDDLSRSQESWRGHMQGDYEQQFTGYTRGRAHPEMQMQQQSLYFQPQNPDPTKQQNLYHEPYIQSSMTSYSALLHGPDTPPQSDPVWDLSIESNENHTDLGGGNGSLDNSVNNGQPPYGFVMGGDQRSGFHPAFCLNTSVSSSVGTHPSYSNGFQSGSESRSSFYTHDVHQSTMSENILSKNQGYSMDQNSHHMGLSYPNNQGYFEQNSGVQQYQSAPFDGTGGDTQIFYPNSVQTHCNFKNETNIPVDESTFTDGSRHHQGWKSPLRQIFKHQGIDNGQQQNIHPSNLYQSYRMRPDFGNYLQSDYQNPICNTNIGCQSSYYSESTLELAGDSENMHNESGQRNHPNTIQCQEIYANHVQDNLTHYVSNVKEQIKPMPSSNEDDGSSTWEKEIEDAHMKKQRESFPVHMAASDNPCHYEHSSLLLREAGCGRPYNTIPYNAKPELKISSEIKNVNLNPPASHNISPVSRSCYYENQMDQESHISEDIQRMHKRLRMHHEASVSIATENAQFGSTCSTIENVSMKEFLIDPTDATSSLGNSIGISQRGPNMERHINPCSQSHVDYHAWAPRTYNSLNRKLYQGYPPIMGQETFRYQENGTSMPIGQHVCIEEVKTIQECSNSTSDIAHEIKQKAENSLTGTCGHSQRKLFSNDAIMSTNATPMNADTVSYPICYEQSVMSQPPSGYHYSYAYGSELNYQPRLDWSQSQGIGYDNGRYRNPTAGLMDGNSEFSAKTTAGSMPDQSSQFQHQVSRNRYSVTFSDLPKKRKKSLSLFVPWHIGATKPKGQLPSISKAELMWATATNRLPDKDTVENQNGTFWRAKRRLRVTTQLVQQLILPFPRFLMQGNKSGDIECLTYNVTRTALEDACMLLSGTEKEPENSQKDVGNPNTDGRHYTRTRSMKKDVTMMRLVVKFMDRIKNLDISLTRLNCFMTVMELRRKIYDLEKLATVNRLAKHHGSDFIVDFCDVPLDINIGYHEPPERYVIALPMPLSLPEGRCLSL